MPKASAIGSITVPNVANSFVANVPPDVFDSRDLPYRSRLQLLDDAVDRRLNAYVLTQEGNSCTGHAVATMINTVFAQKAEAAKAAPDRVSPYMLYFLARRYDEFPGEEDAGSSLRGVLKGWWRHGVALDKEWPALGTHLDLDDRNLVSSCKRRPLGSYYRVDAQRLDDMQSAITELHAIVASAQIHDGWSNPQPERSPDGKTVNYVIRKTAASQPIGGHAFALVGYNDIGFLVQNSWGTSWGKGGFATLPYEDWLESAYDAWVARPGVPQTPFAKLDRVVSDQGVISVGAVPSPDVIRNHVLNLGNDGRLSTNGQATSSPAQLRELIAAMAAKHAEWNSADTVIYIHGGLVAESSGLGQVQEQFQWWLNNHVYPIFIVWESGPMETVLDQLKDLEKRLPFGAGLIQEGFDRLIEKTASTALAFAWSEMKGNALQASDPLPALPQNDSDWFKAPGATLLLRLLEQHAQNHALRLHVVAHSAGAVYANGLIPRLAQLTMPVESLTFMAAASTVDAFQETIVPHLGGGVKRFTSFTMTDPLELHDTCLQIYHKSLLYLVSRGFERPKNREMPLVGMEHFFDAPRPSGPTLRQMIANAGGVIVESSGATPSPTASDDAKCTAQHHGDFHDDPPTMTAVLLRILGKSNVDDPLQRYSPNLQPAAAPAGVMLTIGGRVKRGKGPVVGGPAVVGAVPANKTEKRTQKRKRSRPSPARRTSKSKRR
jgi:hypothetical protein